MDKTELKLDVKYQYFPTDSTGEVRDADHWMPAGIVTFIDPILSVWVGLRLVIEQKLLLLGTSQLTTQSHPG